MSELAEKAARQAEAKLKGNGTAGEANGETERPARPWPGPLATEALRGLAGEIVRVIEPHSEADPAALLIQFLTAFGNAVGSRPHFVA